MDSASTTIAYTKLLNGTYYGKLCILTVHGLHESNACC